MRRPLGDLFDKSQWEFTGHVPTYDTAGNHKTPFGHHLVRITLRLRPSSWLQQLRTLGKQLVCVGRARRSSGSGMDRLSSIEVVTMTRCITNTGSCAR